MKSKKIILLSIAIIFYLLFFYLTPDRFSSQSILVNTNQNSLHRFFLDDDKTGRWWAAYKRANPHSTINITQINHYYSSNLISLEIKNGGDLTKSEMRIIPSAANTSYLRWQLDQPRNKNPVKRLENILHRNRTVSIMKSILSSLKEYTEKNENIYGCIIQKTKVKDTLLAVTKSVLNEYPVMPYVYKQIAYLKQHIDQQKAEERNFPMLYIFKTDNGRFEATIAIPVNKAIKNSKAIVTEHMVAGDILRTQCKGGPSEIRKAFKGLENYMQDYQYSSPALPFELLMVDRLKEADTAKWVTGIYYPIY